MDDRRVAPAKGKVLPRARIDGSVWRLPDPLVGEVGEGAAAANATPLPWAGGPAIGSLVARHRDGRAPRPPSLVAAAGPSSADKLTRCSSSRWPCTKATISGCCCWSFIGRRRPHRQLRRSKARRRHTGSRHICSTSGRLCSSSRWPRTKAATSLAATARPSSTDVDLTDPREMEAINQQGERIGYWDETKKNIDMPASWWKKWQQQ